MEIRFGTDWIVIFFVFGILVLLQAQPGLSNLLESDKKSLLSLRNCVTDDPQQIFFNWANESSPCAWQGITCSNSRVIEINLAGALLQGSIQGWSPADLTALRSLSLQSNRFTGNLSAFIWINSSCSLEFLDLSDNQLSGALPRDLLNSCRNLTHVDFSGNKFLTSIPENFFNSCEKLKVLNLSRNELDGNMSTKISFCNQLQHLNLSCNRLDQNSPGDPLFMQKNCSGKCKGLQRLQTLDISRNNFSGPFFSENSTIDGPFTSLAILNISSNRLTGILPNFTEIFPNVEQLSLSANTFVGEFPPSLGSLSNLQTLDISNNRLMGDLPEEIGRTCSNLQKLVISGNNFTGTLPNSLASCLSLQVLNASYNHLNGSIPEVLTSMSSLQILDLGDNNFTGQIPSFLQNCTKLIYLDLSCNFLSGPFSQQICHQNSPLETLILSDNSLTGEIPSWVSNCSNIKVLDLSYNKFESSIPPEICNLQKLEKLMMWLNNLSGEIPAEIGNCKNLKALILNNNRLTGSIPPQIAECTLLDWLSLSNNRLSGSIPREIGQMQKLGFLQLSNNSMTGSIPSELGNCSSLIWVDMNNNNLADKIPAKLGRQNIGLLSSGSLDSNIIAFVRNTGKDCRGAGALMEFQGIKHDDEYAKTQCSFTRIYPSLFKPGINVSSILYLDLSYNDLDGEIPPDFGYLGSISLLYLAHNRLNGTIPSTVGHMKNLVSLDLSSNKLEGSIPDALTNLTFLEYLNLSSNNLSGQIPAGGQLLTFPASSYANNTGLCGYPLSKCSESIAPGANPSPKHKSSSLPCKKAVILSVLLTVISISAIFLWYFRIRKCLCRRSGSVEMIESAMRKKKSVAQEESLSMNIASFDSPLTRVTFGDLYEATNGFSPESLVGCGGYGTVYKACLADGTIVAVKKLMHFSHEGDREFVSEMDTLGQVRHHNLVPLLGYCKINDERLLIYEFMHGGNLEQLLHGLNKLPLSWELRKQIALDSARGLAFLHHNCVPHIIHRDFKSSNVLLNNEMVAKISDFGMARVINVVDTHVSVTTLTGTPGYVPPEYYQSFRCTTSGDTYSYGVVLLELISRKRATEKYDEFGDTNLAGWAKAMVEQNRILEVVDADIRWSKYQQEVIQYLKIAWKCLNDKPSLRPSMFQVVAMFKEISLNE